MASSSAVIGAAINRTYSATPTDQQQAAVAYTTNNRHPSRGLDTNRLLDILLNAQYESSQYRGRRLCGGDDPRHHRSVRDLATMTTD